MYYTWQLEVMCYNFIKHGVNPSDIHILLGYNDNQDTHNTVIYYDKIQEKYKVNIHSYKDTREDTTYIPSIYFNIVKQHYQLYPELEKEAVFFHDSDILLTRPLDLSFTVRGDVWYLSDTNSYISYNYVISKGEEQYNEMCKIVGIKPEIPLWNNPHSGGAQHVIKNVNYEYWDKVEKDSIELYKYMHNNEPNYISKHEGDYPIQKWTAGMWSLLWNAWYFDHETRVDHRLNFCMATDPISFWDKNPIYHNAGVTENDKGMFFKNMYNNSIPYNSLELSNFDSNRCSYNYVKELLEVKAQSCLL